MCSATGTPQPRITWWKNNQQLVSGSLSRRVTLSSDNKTITIAQTDYFIDKGQYECRAENELAERRMDKATVELTINGAWRDQLKGSLIQRRFICSST